MENAEDNVIRHWRIRLTNTKLYSVGRVTSGWVWDRSTSQNKVTFNTGGKQWHDVKSLKSHLLNCAKQGVDMSNWEVVEFVERSTTLPHDCFDEKMLAKLLR